MTKKQANNLALDLRKSLELRDYREDMYLSFKKASPKSFRSCAFFETDDWLFIWTPNESFIFNKKEIGDFVFISNNEPMLKLKQENKYAIKR